MEEVLTKGYSKKVAEIRKTKVIVRPIRRKGQWVLPDHDSAFMNDGARMGIVVPVLPGNILVDPLKCDKFSFTQSDRENFAQELGLEDSSLLNVHVKKSFWRGNTVFIDRNGLHLDLASTHDFTKYLILNSDTDRIAKSWKERFDKGTYKFAICEEGEELMDKVSALEEKKNAYILLSKMDSSIEKMRDFLYVYYITKKDAKRPPKTANADWLKGEIGRIIEDDLKTFLSILDDPDYTLKLLVQKSIEIGSLTRIRHEYFVPGSDKPIGNLEELLDHLNDPKNQDLRMKLMHQIENTK